MGKKSRKSRKLEDMGLIGFLFESKAAITIILVNVLCFWFFHYNEQGQSMRRMFMLFPGSLLEGRFWTILTTGFLHRDWTHLFLNMLGVFIFARIVERHMGVFKTFFIYFGAIIISMLFSTGVYALVLGKNVAVIGASGAVMGLISAAMLLDPFCITYEMILPIPVMVKGWIFLYADIKGFLGGETDGVSHLAHLCGFLSIIILVYFLSNKDRKAMSTGLIINILSLFVCFLARHWLISISHGNS